MSESEVDTEKIESELRGSTLRVYWHMFKKGEGVGVREVQRALGMASPSTALLVYLIREGMVGSPHGVMTIIFGLSAAAVSWYETYRIWSDRFL